MNPLRGDTAAPPLLFSAFAEEGGAFQRFWALAAALEALGCSLGSSWELLGGLWGLFGGFWGALGSSWAVLGVACVRVMCQRTYVGAFFCFFSFYFQVLSSEF